LSAPESPSRKKGRARAAAGRGAQLVPARATPGRALEPSDTLSRYMAELAHHPPISREEEHALALRWREHGDVEAARLLVLSNLRLVVKIAMEYRRAWTNALDLIQEGNLGLMQAVHRFDPHQGVKLSSYGAYWIRAYILKYILDNIRLVRLGRTRAERKLFFRLNKERRELERRGFEPEPRLLAERLEVPEEEVRSMEQRLAEPELSLNAPVRRDEGAREVGDFIAGSARSAEESVAEDQMRRVFLEKVHAFTEHCDERERRIIAARLLAEEPRTLQELGEEFGVSRERVRQLEARLLERLNAFLKEQLVDYEFYATARD
jgi:RNA polymerase sigma-32 factor